MAEQLRGRSAPIIQRSGDDPKAQPGTHGRCGEPAAARGLAEAAAADLGHRLL
eukprot:CAMPEP_0174698472 /NCGR_PEP_ID=MMETSP1094-20130205/4069_1 /TAXON_ID=156173 /ORGANISM="Chrysochromulina brevifilum, Strain UTEX LB 985" /LENGTH=52 /DNA_ID=CAMNT_0015895661 /DNA_START=58 /DNA_END=212 /DNA_ORIENTATION=-